MNLRNKKNNLRDNRWLRQSKTKATMLHRLKASLLLVLIFISAITTLPILQYTNASALDTSQDNPNTYSNQITSYIYYAMIKSCFERSRLSSGTLGDSISNDNARKGQWFDNWVGLRTDITPGVFMEGAIQGMVYSGATDCGNSSIERNAMSFWAQNGASGMDLIAVLCASGFERETPATNGCTSSTSTSSFKRSGGVSAKDSSDRFAAYIREHVYGNKDTMPSPPSGAQLYTFYLHSLNDSCGMGVESKLTGTGTSDDPSDLNNISWVDISSNPSKIITGYFTPNNYPSGGKPNYGGLYWLQTNKTETLNCKDLASRLTLDLAKEYQSKYDAWRPTANPVDVSNLIDSKNGTQGPTGSTKSSCAVTGIGWIICPIVNFMSGVVDASYGIVSTLLTTPSLSTNTDPNATDNGIYKAWAIMRSFANVAFVIAFLIIIFSQITNVGITNYGIKKMLPRLVIAAILVNLSYFVCVIAVDISNITGNSLKQLFDNMGLGIDVVPRFLGNAGGGSWTGLGELVLGGAAIGYFVGLSILLPALIAAIVAIVVVFLVLTVRQALIIILIVISPIAFVAFLLPNTEDLFKKWQNLLTTLLLMFPIIAAIFGASALASKVIMSDANASFAVQIMGALVAIVPLALTPIIMKAAGGTLGSIGTKIQGLSKAPSDAMNRGAAGVRKRELAKMDNVAMNSTARFNPRRRLLRYNARNQAIEQNQERELTRAKTGYIADATSGATSKLRDQMAAGGTLGAADRVQANAESALSKQMTEEIGAASVLSENLGLNNHLVLAKGGTAGGFNAGNNQALRSANMANVIKSGDTKAINELHDHIVSSGTKSDQIAFANALGSASSRPSYISFGAIESIKQGINPGTSDQLAANAITSGSITAEKLAKMGKDEAEYIYNVASNPANGSNNATLKNSALEATTNPLYKGQVGKQGPALESITKLP